MRVLLLDPDDPIPRAQSGTRWDLVVDLGRAPAATYERWSQQTRARVVSLYDFSSNQEDVRRIQELLHLGTGGMVDASGIDWWDVLSLLIEPDLRQLILMGRLARELKGGCELSASRPSTAATALQVLTGAKQVRLETGFHSVRRWAQHYGNVLAQLDTAQFSQVIQDKFDPEHGMRRWLAAGRRAPGNAVVLLPSAYVNVSRTAVSYAALLPGESFLLVYARHSARLKSVPSNVSTTSLDPYFVTTGPGEVAALAQAWELLKGHLIADAAEYSAANATGVLDRIPGLMRWGIAVRNAWTQLFESETIVGCLCADDSNPYTRLPLILARDRGLPTLACHHGAMDSKMAVKTPYADIYLAKGEIERDYLLRTCGMPAEKIVLGGQGLTSRPEAAKPATQPGQAWLVFFSEPYQAAGWRTEEVYRDLLPRLWALSQACRLKLVFKIHPFESVRGQRRLLRKYLPEHEARIGVIAGAPSVELWRNIRLALTVQSTVALQCAADGIPVFLCSWLRDTSSGYLEQFVRFGIGQVLESAAELSEIPHRLELKGKAVELRPNLWPTMDPAQLRDLLFRTPSFSEPIKARA